MDSSPASQPKEIIDEVYDFIKVYSDGSVERPPFPGGYLSACPDFVKGVASKDITIDPDTGIWARVFLPQSVASSNRKVPIVLHFHGGGLCSGSPAAAAFHTFCSRMAVRSESIWISFDYRLAPEHRLPAAYDDAYSSFKWLHAQSTMQNAWVHGGSANDGSSHGHDARADDHPSDEHGHMHAAQDSHDHLDWSHRCDDSLDPWLNRHADFSKCFLAGESSGGAIVHYLSMSIMHKEWSPIQVRGLLIIHAAFLIEGVLDSSYNPTMERRPGTYRRLCLPLGAEWDHPLVNPLHPQAPTVKDIILPPSIVAVADQDTLCAPAMHYARVMKQCGHKVELYVTEGQGHCFYLRDPKSMESELLLKNLLAFIHGHCSMLKSQSTL